MEAAKIFGTIQTRRRIKRGKGFCSGKVCCCSLVKNVKFEVAGEERSLVLKVLDSKFYKKEVYKRILQIVRSSNLMSQIGRSSKSLVGRNGLSVRPQVICWRSSLNYSERSSLRFQLNVRPNCRAFVSERTSAFVRLSIGRSSKQCLSSVRPPIECSVRPRASKWYVYPYTQSIIHTQVEKNNVSGESRGRSSSIVFEFRHRQLGGFILLALEKDQQS
ncbi:hypothetical protein LR48_Vigan11g160600 [Vigna angularis]|uniref:Uncharacterized protein n=1 Tax=Phaseolus angularis TaxID=3914 RepID=A0A0L9VUR0_PHAAN|nr:hypothetical protein LR48_Vigan11g160600 [Vigna angularis]